MFLIEFYKFYEGNFTKIKYDWNHQGFIKKKDGKTYLYPIQMNELRRLIIKKSNEEKKEISCK